MSKIKSENTKLVIQQLYDIKEALVNEGNKIKSRLQNCNVRIAGLTTTNINLSLDKYEIDNLELTVVNLQNGQIN